jgi:DNA-binding CsgD family transcriptional regulator
MRALVDDCADRGIQRRRLSPPEADVLRLMATGLSSVETAGELTMSLEEVRGHLRSAMLALAAHSKLAAIVAALRSGQLSLPR